MSLRSIAEETSLGLRTVRSILGTLELTAPRSGTLSASIQSAPRRKFGSANGNFGKRCRKRIAAVTEANAELRKEAKGLLG
jgi:hypothetical protein